MREQPDPDGVTPLTPDETLGLIPSFVATRSDLNVDTLERAILSVHHRLVAIHPFPNGNGRHARLFADDLDDLQRFASS